MKSGRKKFPERGDSLLKLRKLKRREKNVCRRERRNWRGRVKKAEKVDVKEGLLKMDESKHRVVTGFPDIIFIKQCFLPKRFQKDSRIKSSE